MEDNANPITIYLIEDDTSVRRAMTRLLATAGYTVEAFAEAEAFLGFPYIRKNALLITDIHLPGIDGLQLQKHLVDDGIAMPVIFITAYDSEEKRAKVKKMGATAYFRKPVDGTALIDAIEWAFTNSRE